GNFCVASVLGSSCTTCTLRSCAPYAPINSSKYLCFERSLIGRLCFKFELHLETQYNRSRSFSIWEL
ncbi:MAG: hypothetical protein LBJ16_01760, partial [Holosporaceae bacterium]|nr:hypothetical protein [Holosporaceae bacterium]